MKKERMYETMARLAKEKAEEEALKASFEIEDEDDEEYEFDGGIGWNCDEFKKALKTGKTTDASIN